jgi:cell division protein FtsI (penicillin-binding protein 3)
VYVVVQNPRGQSYYGSQIAAPIFRSVALSLIDTLGIPGPGTVSVPSPQGAAVPVPRRAAPSQQASQGAVPPPSTGPSSASSATVVEIGSTMPDLRGTPKKLLLPLLLRKDLVVTINGSGYVVGQDPLPGTRIQDGMKIDLELQ